MNFIFRVDASLAIGTGHVMRCLTLADGLQQRGVRCTFVCRPHPANLIDEIERRGHRAIALKNMNVAKRPFFSDLSHAEWLGVDWQTDALDTREVIRLERFDWLVVDHYALDHHWERELRPYCKNLMVIDDLADRKHDCDMLLDQNLGHSAKDYSELVSPSAVFCMGPRYALLRSEFAKLRCQSLTRRESPSFKRLLITMGGVDKDNVTGHVLQALSQCDLPSELEITVVMGGRAPFLPLIRAQATQMPRLTEVFVDTDHMAELMSASDLCIGAAGGTSWERCCLGLPTVLLVLADNQISLAAELKKMGAVMCIKNTQEIAQVFKNLFSTEISLRLKEMCNAAAILTDGKGVDRIINLMLMQR